MGNEKGIELLLAACKSALENDHSRAMMGKAIAASDRGDIETAIKLARKVRDIDPIASDPLLMQAVLLSQEKAQQIIAIDYFNQVIEQVPDNAMALWFLAMDQLHDGQPQKALELLVTACQSEPLDSYVVITRAWLQQMLGRYDETKKLINEQLAKGPPQLVCTIMSTLLTAQSTNLNEINLRGLGPDIRCLLELGYLFQQAHSEEKLLELVTNPTITTRRLEESSSKSGCSHIANPAIDVYRERYGARVTNNYAKAFLKEILIPDCKQMLLGDEKVVSGSTKSRADVPPDMVRVPAGHYTVGCTEPSLRHPDKKRFVPEFFIDRYPVTNSQWREFRPKYQFLKGLENHPVANVDFIQAGSYAAWKGKRLPTEIEWEAAARGPNGFRFPWGQNPNPALTNCAENAANKAPRTSSRTRPRPRPATTTPVTQYPRGASPCGAIDMLGNVVEWINQWGPPSNGRLIHRVAKGGGFNQLSANLACWLRNFYGPFTKHPTIGFRCAMDAFDETK